MLTGTNVANISPVQSRRVGREIAFHDWNEIVAFIQGEIQRSKRSFSDIAKDAGCCWATVANMSSGQTTTPHLRTAVSILIALGYEVVAR